MINTATTKSLNTAIPRFCTILDIILKFSRITTEEINMDASDSPIVLYSSQIDSFIKSSSQRIYAALLPVYNSLSSLADTAPWVGNIVSNKQNSSPSSRLLAAAAGTSSICEHFTLTFTSATTYTVTGFLSGSVGSGTTITDFTSTGGDLIINASSVTGMFSGTFTTGDKIFISVCKWHPFISDIGVYMALSGVLKELAFANGVSIDPGIFERYSNHAKADLAKLQHPDDKDGYALTTLPSRTLRDVNLGDWENDLFDRFGTPNPNYFSEDKVDTYSE